MPVGSFEENKFGLSDVLGNVWEWTSTCTKFVKFIDQDWCLVGGGSWDNYEDWKVQWAYSFPSAEKESHSSVGFRVARELDDKDPKDQNIISRCRNNGCPEAEKTLPECENIQCPKMKFIPPGVFRVIKPSNEKKPCAEIKGPLTPDIGPLLIGKYEVTFSEWDACVEDSKKKGIKLCRDNVSDENWGRGKRPVINVTKEDAEKYLQWLSGIRGDDTGSDTRKKFRLPSEQERQYAARGDKPTCRWWGEEIDSGKANCNACGLTMKQFLDALGLGSAWTLISHYAYGPSED